MTTREQLQQLLSSVPDEALNRARVLLERRQTWPPLVHQGLRREAALARARERFEHFKQLSLAEVPPLQALALFKAFEATTSVMGGSPSAMRTMMAEPRKHSRSR
jgi:hypothetical protein